MAPRLSWEIVSVAAPIKRGITVEEFSRILAEYHYPHAPIVEESGYLVAWGDGIPPGVTGSQCHAPAPHHRLVLRLAAVRRG